MLFVAYIRRLNRRSSSDCAKPFFVGPESTVTIPPVVGHLPAPTTFRVALRRRPAPLRLLVPWHPPCSSADRASARLYLGYQSCDKLSTQQSLYSPRVGPTIWGSGSRR